MAIPQGGAPPGIAITDRPPGRLLITNSTVVHMPRPGGMGSTPIEGLRVDPDGVVLLQNTILWGSVGSGRNQEGDVSNDCEGTVLSLGGNVIRVVP